MMIKRGSGVVMSSEVALPDSERGVIESHFSEATYHHDCYFHYAKYTT